MLMPSLSGLAVICVLVWFQNRGPRRKNHERCPCWKKRRGAQRIASLWALAETRQEAHTHSRVWVPRGSCQYTCSMGGPGGEPSLYRTLESVGDVGGKGRKSCPFPHCRAFLPLRGMATQACLAILSTSWLFPHFRDEETEAQRGQVTCPRSHSSSLSFNMYVRAITWLALTLGLGPDGVRKTKSPPHRGVILVSERGNTDKQEKMSGSFCEADSTGRQGGMWLGWDQGRPASGCSICAEA